MSPRVIREIQLGKRTWSLLVWPVEDPPRDLAEAVPDVDLILVANADEPAREGWHLAASQWPGEPAESWWLSDGNLEACGLGDLLPPFVLVGPLSLLRAFARATGLPGAPESREVVATGGQGVRQRPEPWDLPRYSEEGFLDPFAQEATRFAAIASAVLDTAGALAQRCHQQGLALTLPAPAIPGTAEIDLKPWRTLVPLAAAEDDSTLHLGQIARRLSASDAAAASPNRRYVEWVKASLERFGEVQRQDQEMVQTELAAGRKLGDILESLDPERYREHALPQETSIAPGPVLPLVQRTLLGIAALARAGGDVDEEALALWLEGLAYLETSRIEPDAIPARLKVRFDLGLLTALLHEKGYLWTDGHPGNFGYIPSFDSPIIFDPGGFHFTGQPPTELERARDLAVSRLHCDFLEWEALKLGYRSGAPSMADRVFQSFS